MKKILFGLIITTMLFVGLTIITAPTVWHVPGDFATIQAAVNAVSPGDKIELAGGGYSEQVIIPKSLDLYSNEGAIITAPASPVGYKFTEGGTNIWEPVVAAFGGTVSGTNVSGPGQITVNISGIIVDGNSRIPSPTSKRAVGILFRNVAGSVTHCTVKNMGYSPSFGNSWGIMAYGATNATFRGNNVSGYAKGGFVGNGYPLDLSMPKPNVTIDNNVVTGPPYDPALALAPNGIQLGWGATGKVTNNTVTHHGSPGTKWGGTGVLVQSSPNVLVEGNKAVDNQDYGIATAGYESYGGSYVTGAILKDNTIERNGQGIRIERRSVDTSIQNNTIITNKDGIHVGNAPSASLAPPIGAIINKKTVCPTDSITSTNVQDGIYVVDALLASLIPPVNTDIHNNLIYDNTDFGAFVENNPLQEEVDASSNWWGSCDGPAPYGAGNAVSGNINVLPFLCISKAPIPVITATPLAGFAPLTVTFDGSQSYATESGAVIVDWIWNFGEGSLNEYGVGLQHTYNSAGVYTATLTVKDSFEKRGSTQIKIKVYNVGDLRIDFYSEKNSIKANGKEATYIFAYVHDPEGLVLEDLGLLFGIDNGSLIGSISFDPLTGKYSQQISSGTPGIGNATAILGGTVVGNLQIAYIWPQSPVDLKAIYNGGAFVYHYNLTWSPNPLNSMFDIVKYNIYRDGNLIGSTNTTEFQDTPDLKNVTYGVTAVDSEGDESEIVVAVKQ